MGSKSKSIFLNKKMFFCCIELLFIAWEFLSPGRFFLFYLFIAGRSERTSKVDLGHVFISKLIYSGLDPPPCMQIKSNQIIALSLSHTFVIFTHTDTHTLSLRIPYKFKANQIKCTYVFINTTRKTKQSRRQEPKGREVSSFLILILI